jgi:hypothetical protein
MILPIPCEVQFRQRGGSGRGDRIIAAPIFARWTLRSQTKNATRAALHDENPWLTHS